MMVICMYITIFKVCCACHNGWCRKDRELMITFNSDIDECEVDPDICGFNSKCNNTIGNFTCSCLSGYNGTTGVNCTDINECTKNNPCHSDAKCENTVPFHVCTCKEGYTGNGTYCEGKMQHSIGRMYASLYVKVLNCYRY